MNWRAIGCGGLAIVVFLGIGLLGMSLAFSRLEGCADRLQWGDRAYLAAGTPAAEPSFSDGSPVEIGSTFMGLTTRRVWGPPGSTRSELASDRPDRIFLDCGDGTVRAYAGKSPAP